MDYREPLQSLIPGATGRVLGVLVQTSMPLSGRAVAELAGVSPAQGARVLPRLVELGVVEARSAPPAILYALVPDHVAAGPLQALAGAADRVVEQLADAIARMEPVPSCVGVFGSFARREARVDSDVDLLVVRPLGLDEEDESWRSVVEAIRSATARLTGNRVEVLEVDRPRVPALLRSRKPLWREIVKDFQPIFGLSLREL